MNRNLNIGLVMIALIAAAPCAFGDTYVFNTTTGNWNSPGNWIPTNGPPGLDDFAFIDDGQNCIRFTADQHCQRFSVASGGQLSVSAGKTLTVHGTAGTSPHCFVGGEFALGGTLELDEDIVIDGLFLLAGGTLEIWDSLTAEGTGVLFGTNNGLIDQGGGEAIHVLTLEDGAGGSFVVAGDMDIGVELVNNAQVRGFGSGNTLTLFGAPKSGTGNWRATNNGTLKVDREVTGSGTWVLDTFPVIGGTIQINAACTSLTGDVEISGGTLDVDENFCSTGTLDFSDATIDVAATKSAGFAGACP